jgi:hypothetical protein
MMKKTQINIIKDKKVDITTSTNKIQRMVREYLETLYSSKWGKSQELGKFLYAFNQPKLNQEDIKYQKKMYNKK